MYKYYSRGIFDAESIIYQDMAMRTYEDFLRLLLLEVQKKGWNMGEFSKQMGMSPAWASQLFTGKLRPDGTRRKIQLTVLMLLKIIDVLGISAESLLFEHGGKKVPSFTLHDIVREMCREEIKNLMKEGLMLQILIWGVCVLIFGVGYCGRYLEELVAIKKGAKTSTGIGFLIQRGPA